MVTNSTTSVLLLCCCLLTILWQTPAVRSAEPVLETLFPSGAARGETLEVTISGNELDAATSLYFTRPGVTAERLEKNRFRIQVSADALPGVGDVYVVTTDGLAGPRRFVVDDLEPSGEVDERHQVEQPTNDSPVDAQTLPLPSIVDARFEKAADIDWYQFSGDEGQRISIRCRSRSLGGTVEAAMTLVGPDGGELLHSGTDEYEPLLHLRLPQTGRYRLRVCDRAYQKDAFSFYRMELREEDEPAPSWSVATSDRYKLYEPLAQPGEPVAADEANGTRDSARLLELPALVTARFSTRGEVDWYRFSAEKGQSYWIEAFGERLGQKMDIDVAIHDAAGKQLTLLADTAPPKKWPAELPIASLDPEASWTAPADGDYFLVARDLFGSSVYGDDRLYQLGVSRQQPGFDVFALAGSKPGSGHSIRPGATAKLKLVAVRRGGFDGSIHVRAEQLPEGLQTEGCTIDAKQFSADLQLKASGEAPSGVGRLHLVAENPDEPGGGAAVRGVAQVPAGAVRLTDAIVIGIAEGPQN